MSAQTLFLLRGAAIVLIGAILGSSLAFWLSHREHEAPAPVAVNEEMQATDAPREPAPLLHVQQVAQAGPPLAAPSRPIPSRPIEVASDGIPIMQARGDSTLLGPRHPHPITERHRRIFRENALLGAMNGAVDAADPQALRFLSERYRSEYPEDEPQLQSGYDLIADCLEHPDAETTARAQRYFDEERGSTLRRYVKRHCLQSVGANK